MKRSRKTVRSLLAAALFAAAVAPVQPAQATPAQGQPVPAEAGSTVKTAAGAWETMATADLAGMSGGTRGFDLGIVVDDIQLNASNTTTTVAGNTIAGFDTGEAVGNLMSDIHGFGNTMVVNTGVLTMSNSVNVNVTVDMAR